MMDNLTNQMLNDLLKRVSTLEEKVYRLDPHKHQNTHKRKECKTKDCTREAPQHSSDLCGKCKREKYA